MGGIDVMFEVKQTDEMVNKTFRLPVPLLEELTKVAEHEKVSVNNLVRQCCEYALDNMRSDKTAKENALDGKHADRRINRLGKTDANPI